MARLLSVNVGLPRDISWEGKTVHTAVWKSPVQGRRMVRRLNIDGDGQGDLAGHGGEQRAVFVYQMGSYQYWEEQLQRKDFSYGQFGENFTVDGLSDDEVCIGDRCRIGSALFEVTQPRVTCYRVGIRMNEPRMPALLVEHHRPGFYFRVLQDGEVGAGDEVLKVADGPLRMTVAQTDALLYLPGPSREELQKAVEIPALSEGWKGSFRAMLLEPAQEKQKSGNAGLGVPTEPPPAWPGFRRLRVARITLESKSVMSLILVPDDGLPLSPALPGQFVVLRLHPNPNAPPVLRNYSLSDVPSRDHYRVSVKHEANGVASTFLDTQVRQNDVLDVSAPRGSFTLRSDTNPIVLLSAGVGATPVLAMLHALAAESSMREVWWVYGARNGGDHPFHQEVRGLMQSLPHGRTNIRYSQPRPEDRVGADFDAAGHVTTVALQEMGVPREADFYLCGPTPFLRDLTAGLSAWGVNASNIHTEIFGPEQSITPGVAVRAVASPPHPPEGPAGDGPRVSFARSGLTVPWNSKFGSLLEFAEACDVSVRWSCRTGVCHTCESGLISGTVSYQPEPLQAPADGNLLICCAKPQEEIVLDL
jgi:ferredoxin-NADP reductase/MOSC domain-containing protein YiiM